MNPASRRAIKLTFLATASGALFACNRGANQSQTVVNDWPSYNRTLDGQRFSPLTQIDTANVARLKPVCDLKLGEEGAFHAGPIVVGNTLFITTSHLTVAMSATDCIVRWRHVDTTGTQDPIVVNRGVAYADGKLFRGMPGTRLAAFDAATGKVLWNVKIGEISVSEFVSSAPIAWNGMVFVGLAGSDWGIRGRMMAFDANTGKELWHFFTIPMGSERGAETWHIPESARHGGGAQWTSYTLDPATGELFVPVANPAPDFTLEPRPGDNLFTNSVIVLDAKSGQLKWWYQATPEDAFDYDMGAAPMLYTAGDGAQRVAAGSKDGFVYFINRSDHKLAFKTPITTVAHATAPSPTGVHACPGPLGGVEWNGPSFDAATGLVIVGSVDWCATFTTGVSKYVQGQVYMGTGYQGDSAEKSRGWVTAIDGNTGAVRWKFNTPQPVVAGVTPTAGGVVFTGDLAGNFYAFNAATGKVLRTVNTGGAIAGGVITYMVGGKQYVATTSGNVSRSTFQTTGSPRIMILAVDAPEGMQIALSDVTSKVGPKGGPPGQQPYGQYCASCHGTQGEGGSGGPSLQKSTRTTVEAIADFVKNPKAPMPKLHPSPLDDAAVAAVSEYVKTLQGTGSAR